jgi:CPA2 family monovalent cation:H+ antiporter-2
VGAVAGPGGLGIVDEAERVRTLAELGVVFLLFEIGLELPMDRVRRIWRRAAIAGALQVGLTIAAVCVLAIQFGVSVERALVLGALVAMSSTALVIRVLSTRGEIDAPHGQLSVGILLMQDLFVVPFLLIVPLLGQSEDSLTSTALASFAQSVVALILFAIAARFVLPRILHYTLTIWSREVFTLIALLVVLGGAWVAEEIGLTLAIGAFIGGLVLSASPYAHQLFAEVVPLRGILIGVFFTAVGMLLEPAVAIEGWPLILLYVVSVVFIKTAIVASIVALALRQGWRIGLVTGLGLAQTGEFSFVLASVAFDAGLLDALLQQVFVAGSIVTLAFTPLLAWAAPKIAQRLFSEGPSASVEASDARRGHVVLLGCGFAGQTMARVLRAREIDYLGVDASPVSVQKLRERGESVIHGDVTRRALLERVGVAGARLVVITVSDPIATREAARLVNEIAPDVPIVVRTRFVLDVDPLYSAGADLVVAEEFESTLEIVFHSLRTFGVPDEAIATFTRQLREEGYEALRKPELALDPWLAEILEEVSTQWIDVGRTDEEAPTLASLDVRRRTGCNVLAIEHHGERIANPEADQQLVAGDRLLAFGTPGAIDQLARLVSVPD